MSSFTIPIMQSLASQRKTMILHA